MKSDFNNAIEQWRELLGEDCITDVALYPAFLKSATFNYDSIPAVVLRPHDVGMLQVCVQIANQCKTPLYPISTGKNIGYGSGLAIQPDSVIVLLDKLTQINAFHSEVGIISIQPGVTQLQISEYLREIKTPYYLGMTGSCPESSIIGNILERGEDAIYGDRHNHIISMKILLMTGEIIDTGFSRFNTTEKFINVYPAGIGPSIDSLFLQSNFGIVIQMDIQLPKITGVMKFVNFKTNNHSLEKMLSGLKTILENHITTIPILMLNANRVNAQSENMQYKDDEWHVSISLFEATDSILSAKLDYLNDYLALNHEFHATSCDADTINSYRFDPILPIIKNDFTYLDVISYRLDIPTSDSFKILYHNKSSQRDSDYEPEQDQCGAIFFSIISPNTPGDMLKVIDITNTILSKHNFDSLMTINIFSAHCVIFHISMIYDREQPNRDAEAQACEYELLGTLHQSGYLSKRLSINSMHTMPAESPDYTKMMQKMKKLFDPNHLLSMGRYEFNKKEGEE